MHILRGVLNIFTCAPFKSLETTALWDVEILHMVQWTYMGLTLRRET